MGTLIRHAGAPPPVLPLPVAMVESAFRTVLIAAVGAASLFEPCLRATSGTAIPLSPITVLTNPENRPTLYLRANSLAENRLALMNHRPQTGQHFPIRK
jgi:hypothetical protein